MEISKFQSALVAASIVLTAAVPALASTSRHHSHHTRPSSHHVRHHVTHASHSRRSRASSYHTRHAGLVRAPYSHAVYYTGGGGDYLGQTEGESRWPDGHTIHVYVAPGRPSFPGIISSCFNEWSRATGGRIRFALTPYRDEADYTISWTSRQKEVSEGTEAGLTTTDTYVDPETGQEYIERARTNILTRYDGRQLSDKEIAETCLHEIGHGLGIEGHSSNPRDIMYYAVSSKQSGHLTDRDANTIARLYAE